MEELKPFDFFLGIMLFSFVLFSVVVFAKIVGNSPDLQASKLKAEAFQAKCDSITYETKVRHLGFYKNALDVEVVGKVDSTTFKIVLRYPHGAFVELAQCKDLEIL